MKRTAFRLALVILIVGLAGCGPPRSPTQSADVPEAVIPLPTPSRAGSLSLEEALVLRRSVRSFDPAPLALEELGQLLWAAQGITHGQGHRTAPSAGALYPLEIYVATEEAVFHYDPQEHSVTVVSRDDVRTALYEVAGRQAAIRQAPAVFIVTAVFERTAAKYGPARSPRYVHLEAGHASQNLALQAVALGLGAVTIGAFDDEGVKRALDLPSDHEPLYLIPVGNPKGAGGKSGLTLAELPVTFPTARGQRPRRHATDWRFPSRSGVQTLPTT